MKLAVGTILSNNENIHFACQFLCIMLSTVFSNGWAIKVSNMCISGMFSALFFVLSYTTKFSFPLFFYVNFEFIRSNKVIKIIILITGISQNNDLELILYTLLIGSISYEIGRKNYLICMSGYFTLMLISQYSTNFFISFSIMMVIACWKDCKSFRLNDSREKIIHEKNTISSQLHTKTRFIATLTHEIRNIVTRYFHNSHYKKHFVFSVDIKRKQNL